MTIGEHNPGPAPQRDALKPAHYYAATRDWEPYFDAIETMPPRETLMKALSLFAAAGMPGDADAAPLAYDLACGSGRDVAEMVSRGWRVTATDSNADALRRVTARLTPEQRSRVSTAQTTLETTTFPAGGVRFINASFALPFCPPGAFDALWDRIVAALPIGGRFAGQFFGDQDSWASLPDRSHQSPERIAEMLRDFEREHFVEERRDSSDRVHHPKFWHVFHVVARKVR